MAEIKGRDMDIKKEFEKNRERFISDLQGLIRIPSVATEADEEYPFGKEVQRAFSYMLNLGKSMGFEVKNVDNYGGHIDFPGSEEGIMAVVGHIDVVPEGDGWTYDPFGGTIEDDWIVGRGAQDDKGPTMAGLYAMKVLKDLGFQPKKTVRLILGLDEEASWDGMRYYLQHEKAPDFGIVPDADFPLVQCEKGLLQLNLVKESTEGTSLTGTERIVLEQIEGGTAPNVVAGHAEMVITGTETELEELCRKINIVAKQKEYEIKAVSEDGRLSVSVSGIPAHAAVPEKGKNAISMAIDLIRNIRFANDDANHFVNFYNEKIGFVLDGSRIGCKLEDELSGALTFNVGGVVFNSSETRITVDIRYPVTESKESVCNGLETAVKGSGFVLEVLDHIRSIYQESDNPVVKTLVETYREISGDTESQPSVIGGATFARAIPNCMAFGALFPGDPELEHQKDEKVQISQMIKAGSIYAEAIYRLTK
jgi:succinyl-diaminopimelate desuccinylase